MATPGLANVQVEDTPVETPTETTAPLSAKAVAAKGPYALPTTKGVGGVDETLLENMRQLIAEREAQKNSLLEGLKDATAWWSGGMAGPSEALARRSKEREEQAATTFGMKRDLAQYQVAQQQAQNLQRQLFGTGTPAAATPQGQAAQPGAAAPATTPGQGGLLSLVRDPGLQQSIAVQAQTDQPGALKSIQAYLAKNAEDPQLAKDVNWMVKNGLIDPKILPAAVLTKFVGPGAFVPHDVLSVSGGVTSTKQGTPFAAASGVASGASPSAIPGAAAPAPVTPKVATPSPTASASVPAAPLTTTATPTTQVLPHAQPLPKIEATGATPLAPTQTTAPALPSSIVPGSKEAAAYGLKQAEVPLSGQTEFAQSIEKQNAVKASQVDTAGLSAGERKVRFNDIKSITEDPDMQMIFGKLAKKGLTPFILKQLESGVNAGQFGTIGVGNLERNLMEAGASPTQIERLHKVEKSLGAAELDYAKTYLTGQGAVSDNERKLVKASVGSVTDPAKVLNMQASVMAERAEFDEKIAAAYDRYRDTHGEYASFGKFMRSPEAKRYINEHNTTLAQIIGRKPNELGDPFNSKGENAVAAPESKPGGIGSFFRK